MSVRGGSAGRTRVGLCATSLYRLSKDASGDELASVNTCRKGGTVTNDQRVATILEVVSLFTAILTLPVLEVGASRSSVGILNLVVRAPDYSLFLSVRVRGCANRGVALFLWMSRVVALGTL